MTASRSTDPSSPAPEAGSKVDQVKEEARHVAQDARSEASGTIADLGNEASNQLGHVKDDAVTTASDLLVQVRDQVGTQADQGTHQLAETLTSAGRELTDMADRSENTGPMTTVVRELGTRATDMGERFGNGGYKALAGDLTGFARSSPGLFLLAAAGAGFAAGRVVRNADTGAIASAARAEEPDDSGGPDDFGGPDGSGQGSTAAPGGATGLSPVPMPMGTDGGLPDSDRPTGSEGLTGLVVDPSPTGRPTTPGGV